MGHPQLQQLMAITNAAVPYPSSQDRSYRGVHARVNPTQDLSTQMGLSLGGRLLRSMSLKLR